MTRPELVGISHVSLTVTDVPRSSEWYQNVLGFEVVVQIQQNELFRVILAGHGFSLALTSHGDQAQPGEFSERRNGLDHLSFGVADSTALNAWASYLESLGIAHSDETQGASGRLIAFRDPDNIALEFYTVA